VELKEETHEPPQKKNKNLRGKQSKKEPRVKEERKEPRFKEERKEKRESPKKESPKRESHERKESNQKMSNVKEIEEEVSKETKEIKMETEALENERENEKGKEKKNLQLEFSHKEEFSLEATTPKNSTGNNSFSNKSNTQTASSGNFNNFYGQFPPYFFMNGMMNSNMGQDMNNMDKKGKTGPILMYAPVLVDPSTMNMTMNMNMKEMNGQNMGMPFPMMPFYPNYTMPYNQSNKK
jgi:hypothetical protein